MDRDPMFFSYVFIAAAGVLVLAAALWSLRGKLNFKWSRGIEIGVRPALETLPDSIKLLPEASKDKDDEAVDKDKGPKCLADCDFRATEIAPRLERSRGGIWDWLRDYFMMPPRYHRVIDAEGVPTLCRSHAHVVDAMVSHFIATEVHSAFTEAYQKVAVRSAAFEQEGLQKLLQDSLTEDQKLKRAGTKPASERVLRIVPPKTGTDASE